MAVTERETSCSIYELINANDLSTLESLVDGINSSDSTLYILKVVTDNLCTNGLIGIPIGEMIVEYFTLRKETIVAFLFFESITAWASTLSPMLFKKFYFLVLAS